MLHAKVKKVLRETAPNSWEVPGGVAAEIVDVIEQMDSETWRVRIRGVEFRVIELNSPRMPKEGDLMLIEEEPLNPILRN